MAFVQNYSFQEDGALLLLKQRLFLDSLLFNHLPNLSLPLTVDSTPTEVLVLSPPVYRRRQRRIQPSPYHRAPTMTTSPDQKSDSTESGQSPASQVEWMELSSTPTIDATISWPSRIMPLSSRINRPMDTDEPPVIHQNEYELQTSSLGLNNNETVPNTHLQTQMTLVTEAYEWPPRIDSLFRLPTPNKEDQTIHSWNPEDASEHIFVQESDPYTFHRHPTAQSTDAIRGKVGYSKGMHMWEISWHHQQRGTHAVIGVSTRTAPLHVHGYQSLIGNNDESWGWDITRCRALHDVRRCGWRPYPLLLPGGTIGKLSKSPNKSWYQPYPVSQVPRNEKRSMNSPSRGNAPESFTESTSTSNSNFHVPQTVFVILDMDQGTLSFALDKQFLGIAFTGLKGKTLFPAVSAVWGHCEVTMRYLGNLPPGPLSLMQSCRRVIWREIKQTAKRKILNAHSASLYMDPTANTTNQLCLHQLNNNNNIDLFTIDCLLGGGSCRRRASDLAALIAGNKPNFVIHPSIFLAWIERLPIPKMHIDYLVYRPAFNNYHQLPPAPCASIYDSLFWTGSSSSLRYKSVPDTPFLVLGSSQLPGKRTSGELVRYKSKLFAPLISSEQHNQQDESALSHSASSSNTADLDSIPPRAPMPLFSFKYSGHLNL